MISPAEIVEKAARRYSAFLTASLQNEPFTVLSLPVGKPPTDLDSLRREGIALKESEKATRGYGYEVAWITRQTRSIGTQDLPDRITISTAQDYLRLIGKTREFATFEQDIAYIREQMPLLEGWLHSHPIAVIENHPDWHNLIEVCRYFLSEPRPNLYIRALPIPVHTKFIEQHQSILRSLLEYLLPSTAIDQEATGFELRFGLRRPEPYIHLRALDRQLEKQFGLPVDDLSLPLSQLAALKFTDQYCLIVENRMNFLALPAFANTIAIWGKGFQVTLLGQIGWLHSCRIIYWGDLDVQGFQILSALRSHFSASRSIMMDRMTFDQFQTYAVPGLSAKTSLFPALTSDESAMAAFLEMNTRRLEQEHISQAYAVAQIEAIVNRVEQADRL